MLRIRNIARTSLTLLLAAGLGGCGSDQEQDQRTLDDQGLEDLGMAGAELGIELPSCSTAASSGFGTGQVLTLTLTGQTSTIMIAATPAGKIMVNGWKCVNSSGVPLTTSGSTTTAVKKIVVTGDAAASEKVILDMLPASFGSTILSGATGTGFALDLGAGQTDQFMLRGTTGLDRITMGNSAAGDVYVDLNGDNKADVKVVGAEGYAVTLLGGADIFTAAGGAVTAASLTAGVTSLIPMTQAITVYGGPGADQLQGGNGNDVLDGGDDNDTFKTSTGATADGNDKYFGAGGTDTMDYSGRTADLTVTVGPVHAVVTGSVDLTTLTYPDDLDTTVLDIKIDGGATVTTTFAAPADENDVVDQINAEAGVTVASLDASNQLVLTSGLTGPNTSIQVVAGGSALAVLGLVAATTTGADADDGQSGEADDVTYTVESIIGGSGNDALTGSDQYNTITGGAGHDTIDGVANASCPPSGAGDTLNGGAGNDKFSMSAANCSFVVSGGAGTDTIDFSARTADLVLSLDGTANDGDPLANAGAGEKGNINAADVELVLGGSGGDVITASTSGAELHGGAGDDTLNGAAGADTLVGDAGGDILNGGAGDDLVVESPVFSLVSSTLASASTITPSLSGTPSAYDNVIVEITTGGTTGGVAISYKVSKDNGATWPTVVAGASAATIVVDGVTLSLGNPKVATAGDVISWQQFAPTSGDGDDLINGGAGNDKVDYSGRSADLTITLCVDAALTGAPSANPMPAECADSDGDPLLPEDDNVVNLEWLVGGSGADTLTGASGNETIEGGADDDAIHGGDGDDVLYGDAGDDTLYGDDGDDYVEGGAGDDAIEGGDGDGDICVSDVSDLVAALTCEL